MIIQLLTQILLVGTIVTQQQCAPPLIQDQINKKCYDSGSQCGQLYYNRIYSSCVTQCPQDFTTGFDQSLQVKICIEPSSFLLWGLTFKCESPYIRYLGGIQSCMREADKKQCNLYYLKDKNQKGLCLSECPNGFTQDVDSTNSIKICTSSNANLDFTSIFSCNKVIDIPNLSCLDKPENCQNYFLKESKICVKNCPENFTGTTDSVTGKKLCIRNTYVIRELVNCGSSYIAYFSPKKRCFPQSESSQCDMVLAKDSVGIYQCLPSPPVGWTQSQNQPQQIYNSPGDFKWETSQIFTSCSNKVLDLVNLACVNDATGCGSNYYVREMNACVAKCPSNYTPSTDPNTSVKYCAPYDGVNPDYGKYILPKCDTYSYLYFQQNKCIYNDNDCEDFIMKDSNNNKLCWPICPSGYTQGTNPIGKKTCQVPTGTLITDFTIWNCNSNGSVMDVKTLTCLQNQDSCTGLYGPQVYVCFTKCPKNGEQRTQGQATVCIISPGPSDNTECQENSVQNLISQTCFNKPEDCDQILLTDESGMFVCIPECPLIWNKTLSQIGSVNNKQTCRPPTGTFIKTSNFSACTQIKDLATGGCLDNSDKCVGVYIESLKICISQCPDGYILKVDSDGKKTCKYEGPGNQHKTISCPTGTIADILNQACLQNAKDCNQYLIYDESGFQQCVPVCPFPYIKGRDLNLNILTCSPPKGVLVSDNIEMSNCQTVRGLSSGMCYQDESYCVGIFVKSIRACISECPLNYVLRINSANNKTCRYEGPGNNHKIFKCDDGYFPDFLALKCIKQPSECKGYYLKDNNNSQFCYPNCPLPYINGYDSNLGVNICNPPKSGDVSISTEMNTCQSVRDMATSKCVEKPSDCVGIYISYLRMCIPQCPPDHIVRMDASNAVTCTYLGPGNGNKSISCDSGFYPDQLNLKCLKKPEQCDQYLLQDPPSKRIFACLPGCPYQVSKDTTLNINICQPANGGILDDQQFANCQKVRNLSSGTCIEAAQCSGILLKFVRLCISSCPSGYSLKTDSAGNQTCVSPLKCPPPQILDVASQTCLITISDCKGFFNKNSGTCEQSCNTGYKSVQDNTLKVKVCIPCFFTDNAGNCYEKCPQPLFALNGKCESDITLCTGFFTKELLQCDPSCPYRYSPVITSTPKFCIPCNGSCGTQDTNLCKEKLSSDKQQCARDCPSGEVALPKQTNQSYQQCQKCPSNTPFISQDGNSCLISCESSQAINKNNNRCINPQICAGVLFSDTNKVQWCIEKCPSTMQTEIDQSNGAKFCKFCDANQYFNILTSKCESSCQIFDASKTFCLRNINDCKGFISSDNSKCNTKCSIGEKFRLIQLGQYQCIIGDCNQSEFLNDKDNSCVQNCPKGQYGKNGKCQDLTSCSGIYSSDGTSCLEQCPLQFFPDGNPKKCKLCTQKLSSDGLKCNNDCGSGELYDLDNKKCITQDKCSSRLISSDGKSCSNQCPKGEIQTQDNAGKKSCLAKITDCKNKISSDFMQCNNSCQANEAEIKRGSNTVCTFCPLGVSNDKMSCMTECPSGSILDPDQKDCINSTTCASRSKFVSVNGKRCVSSCIFPDVKRPNDSQKCYDSCDTNQIYDSSKGCQSATSCTGYVSSDGKLCVQSCSTLTQAIDDSATNPKRCKSCSSDQTISYKSGIVTCLPKSDDSTSEAKTQAKSIADIIRSTEITPEIKKQVKSQIESISSSLEGCFKQTKQDTSLSVDDMKKQLISIIQNLEDLAQSFISKIKNSKNDSSQSTSDNILFLGSNQFQLVSEKKKEGFIFSTQFSLTDFYGAAPPALQKDSSSLDLSKTGNLDSSIDSLQATNLLTNPYCNDIQKCGSSSLFSVKYNKVSNRRLLAESSDITFNLDYINIDSSKIEKTVCVSFDTNSGAMSPSITTMDKANNKINCQFTTNSALYYDSSCAYVDQTLCQSTNSNNNNPSNPTVNIPTNSLLISSNLLVITLIIIQLLI